MKKTLPPLAALIPDQAELVFKGVIFDVYQWQQKLFDGSHATFEMLKRPDTVQVIAIKDNKLVMVQDEQPGRASQLHFPGGRADTTDASWEMAAKRELQEETGLSFTDWKLIAVYQPLIKIEHFVPWFVATVFSNEQPQQLDNGEKIAVELMAFEQVREAIFSPGNSMLAYAIPLFTGLNTLADTTNLPAFNGQEVER